MTRRCVARVGAGGVLLALGLPAQAEIITLHSWDVRLGYGVLGDGGSLPTPNQGSLGLPAGFSSSLWQQTDGVADARARANSTITLAQTPGGLNFAIDWSALATATVGDNPAYAFERGVSEVYLESIVLDVTLHAPATITLEGASLGGLAPGTHTLSAGSYLLDLNGAFGRAAVDVGAGQSATSAGAFHLSARIVPAPGSAGLLLVLACVRRRRPRGPRRD